MPLFMYRCPKTGYRVQGFVAEDNSEDSHVYEPVTCPVCHQIHHVNPHTGVVLGEMAVFQGILGNKALNAITDFGAVVHK